MTPEQKAAKNALNDLKSSVDEASNKAYTAPNFFPKDRMDEYKKGLKAQAKTEFSSENPQFLADCQKFVAQIDLDNKSPDAVENLKKAWANLYAKYLPEEEPEKKPG